MEPREPPECSAAHKDGHARATSCRKNLLNWIRKSRLVCNVGGAYLFSAAHLAFDGSEYLRLLTLQYRLPHACTWQMYSVGSERRNIDSKCTGTTMGDYLRGTDFSHLPDEAISMYLDGTELQYAKA